MEVKIPKFKLTPGVISLFLLLCVTFHVLIYDLTDAFGWLYTIVINLIIYSVEIARNTQNINVIPLTILAEIMIVKLSSFVCRKTRFPQRKDRLDMLLEQSRETLRKTNEYLEKWRKRRERSDYSYMDEYLDAKPTKVEVPVLHMAIIDTLGTTRSSPDRGDAGDTINIKDTTLLSYTSLIDEEYDEVSEATCEENIDEEITDINYKLNWNVIDE